MRPNSYFQWVISAHNAFSVFTIRCFLAASNRRHYSSRISKLFSASTTSFSLLTTAALNWVELSLSTSSSWYRTPHSSSQLKVKVMLRQTVSQSICRGVKFTLEPVTRYYILSESCCVVSVGRPLWREVGSVSCQSLSSVFSPLSKIQYNLHCACYMF
jgi:hypothetical protein